MKILDPAYQEAPEESLLAWFIEGDRAALEALLIRREKWLWNVAKKSVRDTSLAEEALQEALVLIWKNAHTFRGESQVCLLYTSPSPRDRQKSRMPSSA